MDEILIYQGDCLEVMKTLPSESIDSIVTDPPYELGFMGKKWDNTGIANNKEMWAECLRVLKSGGYLLSFGGTRTYHRMACAIEDAGFEVRDMIEWVYGSGFPKSLNVGKAVDKLQGNEREDIGENPYNKLRGIGSSELGKLLNPMQGKSNITKGTSEWEGWGTALKPAHEPICMARKPLLEKTVAENVLKYGTGGINIDESRVEAKPRKTGTKNEHSISGVNGIYGKDNRTTRQQEYDNKNIQSRFPANLIHDNSDEVLELFPNTHKAGNKKDMNKNLNYNASSYQMSTNRNPAIAGDNGGSASRFFKSIIYQAKASKSERNKGCEGLEEKDCFQKNTSKWITDPRHPDGGYEHNPIKQQNNHPTVKPVALMEYLINMVTPKCGVVLDPFAGSGSTLVAAKELGFNFIGIEKESEYIKICEARINTTQLFNETLFQECK